MLGRYCRLEPLVADAHAAPLFEAYGGYPDESNWTYLPYGLEPSNFEAGRQKRPLSRFVETT